MLAILFSLLVVGLLVAASIVAWKRANDEKEQKRQQTETIASLDSVDRINGIPKIIHQIWIGDKAAPPKKWLDTWSRTFMSQNPGYVYVLWRDDDLKHLKMHNRALYDAEPTLPGKADVARYEILYRYGGVYVDADIVWLGKPQEPQTRERKKKIQTLAAGRDAPGTFDQFLQQTNSDSKLFVVCEPHNPENVGQWNAIGVSVANDAARANVPAFVPEKKSECLLYANSIIGASQQNPHMLAIIDFIATTYAQRRKEHPEQPWLTTGPFPMTESLKSTDKNNDITVFESNIFYPEDWHSDHSAKKVSELRKRHSRAYTFHYGYSTTASATEGLNP